MAAVAARAVAAVLVAVVVVANRVRSEASSVRSITAAMQASETGTAQEEIKIIERIAGAQEVKRVKMRGPAEIEEDEMRAIGKIGRAVKKARSFVALVLIPQMQRF